MNKKFRIDGSLIIALIVLIAFGLLMTYSTTSYSSGMDGMIDQAKKIGIGLFLCVITAVVGYNFWLKLAPVAYFLSIVCMFLVDFTSFGKEVNGVKRWFGIGNRTIFQPTELVKVSLILFATFLLIRLKNRIDDWKILFIYALALAIPIGLVVKNNLSSGIIIFLIVFSLTFLNAKKKKWYILSGVIALGLIVLAYFFGDKLVDIGILEQYQWRRIYVWKDPEAYSELGGYQVLQGLYAIGSGGFFGKGIGNSVQKLGKVPEAQNDMIFSIICEELGVFGAICVLALYGFIIYRIYVIAKNSLTKQGTLIAIGVMVHLALQVILNVAVVTNMIPNTGVTLPFISSGGSSAFFTLIEIGLVFSINIEKPKEEKAKEIEEA